MHPRYPVYSESAHKKYHAPAVFNFFKLLTNIPLSVQVKAENKNIISVQLFKISQLKQRKFKNNK